MADIPGKPVHHLLLQQIPEWFDILDMHDDRGWKKQTTRLNCRFSAASLALRVIFVRRKCPPIYASCMMISGGRTEQHVVIGFGERATVD